MTHVAPAEAFPPGEFLRDELKARGWSQVEFAEIIGRPVRLVNEIIAGKRGITAETAVELGAALGTSPQFWMNLETAYKLYEVRRAGPAPDRIVREARLRGSFPVREMIRRDWIAPSEDPATLEARILRFFEISSLDEQPRLAHAAKLARYDAALTPLQTAWLYRVKQVAEATQAGTYSEACLRDALPRLAALRAEPEEIRNVPSILAECGVRFVIVEPMPSSKIDGVCLWLDGQPVVGMSLRFDRIDNFWFVLWHELEHVLRGDGKQAAIVDSDLEQSDTEAELPREEITANAAAADFCVPVGELSDFLARVGAAVPEERLVLFARRIGVHPGLVVGQLQRRLKRYNLLRRHLVRIREIVVVAAAMTDGYGRRPLRESA